MRWSSVLVVILCLNSFKELKAEESPPSRAVQLLPNWQAVFEYEPSIRMVQVMALSHSGLGRGVLANMQNRVRRAAWLPQLGFRVTTGRDIRSRDVVSLALEDSSGDTSVTETRTGEMQFEATMKFHLGGLVYDPEEVDLARENRYAAHSRLALLTRVTDVYFSRRRIQVELYTVQWPPGPERRLRILKVEQLTAELDGLTGGQFSRQLNGVSR